MSLTIPFETGRHAMGESIDGFLEAAESIGELDLLEPSRCAGWSRMDVVVHVLAGWQEMFGGLVSPVESEPTVDAASFWTQFADQYTTDDPIPVIMSQRRRTAAYARPASAMAQLRDVAEAARRAVDAVADRPVLWDGRVYSAGDYLAVWAVEDVVHQLDLRVDVAPPASGLSIARNTIEALIDEPLPAGLDDAEATLIGTGRIDVPADWGALAARLPALG
ncbi:maleylpyruvate isomerase family mycothiol-dependent enzyme [Nocardioides sp. GXZ039]|uniref:maleylpyruvate isomerase family mycothiol-dependent enzyme n=1 Tax=Nocardioides sp. GXZ039 TaxID=3136018 RepID=UPI0030F47DC9